MDIPIYPHQDPTNNDWGVESNILWLWIWGLNGDHDGLLWIIMDYMVIPSGKHTEGYGKLTMRKVTMSFSAIFKSRT